MPRVALASLFSLAALTVMAVACSAPEAERVRSSDNSLITGDDDHQAVVRVESAGGGLCSGVLVAPNVVLTARHCIAELDADKVRCGANVLVRSRVSTTSRPPSDMVVTVDDGTRAPFTSAVKVIHAPSDDVLCDGDVAALVLDASVPPTRARPLAMRLDVGVLAGERFTVAGFGKQPDGTVGERHHREGILVERVGPRAREDDHPALGAHEIETATAFCQGDSGGPALDPETGSVVAIVSRNESCTAPHGYVFTLISGFRTMIEQAFASAGAGARMTVDESGYAREAPKRAVGNECTTKEDCASGVCIDDAGTKYCSRACYTTSPDRECPPEWSCNGVADSSAKICSRGVAPRVESEPRPIRLDTGEGQSTMSCSASPTRLNLVRDPPRIAFVVIIVVAAGALLFRRRGEDEPRRRRSTRR